MDNLKRPPSQGGISAGAISRDSMTPEMIGQARDEYLSNRRSKKSGTRSGLDSEKYEIEFHRL